MIPNVRMPDSRESSFSNNASCGPSNSKSLSGNMRLLIEQDLDMMTWNWSAVEHSNERRLVKFHIFNVDASHNLIRFCSVLKSSYNSLELIISCIYWKEADLFIVTSVDIILLLENLILRNFTIEEKNRIRRNLQSLKPYTVSKTNKDDQRFFSLIMSMENPRPRNIEKDLKVFKWCDLYSALNKVVSKYSFTQRDTQNLDCVYQPMVKAENNLPKAENASRKEAGLEAWKLAASQKKNSVLPLHVDLKSGDLKQISGKDEAFVQTSGQSLDAMVGPDKCFNSNDALNKLKIKSLREKSLDTHLVRITNPLTRNLAKTISKAIPFENEYPHHATPILYKGSVESDTESSDSSNSKSHILEVAPKGEGYRTSATGKPVLSDFTRNSPQTDYSSNSSSDGNSSLNSRGSSSSSVDISSNDTPSHSLSNTKTNDPNMRISGESTKESTYENGESTVSALPHEYLNSLLENGKTNFNPNYMRTEMKETYNLPRLSRYQNESNKLGSCRTQLPPLKKVNASQKRYRGILPSPLDIVFNIEEYRKKSNVEKSAVPKMQ